MSSPTPRRPAGRDAALPPELKIVDMSHLAEREAKFRSEKKFQEPAAQSSEQLRWWKKLTRGVREAPKNIWNSLTKQYQKNKELRTIREQIDASGELYHGRGESPDDTRDSEEAMKAILSRFDRSYEAADVLTEGESIEHFDAANNRADVTKLRTDVYDLISEYAHGSMSDAAFLQQKKRLFDAHFHGNRRPSVSLYADNALEIAQITRAEISHLDKIKDLDITLGRARSQYKSESEYTFTDKAVDFLQKNKITEKIPPSVISAGVAAAIGATVVAKGIATGLARAATFGVGGGVVVGTAKYFEESKRLKDERIHVAESLARGEHHSDTAKRRKELAEFSLEMLDAEQVIAQLERQFFVGETLRSDLNEAEQKQLLQAIGDIEGRIRYNDLHQVDTIAYGGSQKESLHTRLMQLRAKAKVQFTQYYGMSKAALQRKIDEHYLDLLQQLDISKQAKDEAFQTFRRTKALKEAIKGGIKGVVFGAAIQEATAFFNDSVDGVMETGVSRLFGSPLDHSDTTTTLEGLRQWISGEIGAVEYLNITHDNTFNLPDQGEFRVGLPEGYGFVEDKLTGEWFLTGQGIAPIPVEVDPNTGMFTHATLESLRNNGFQDLNAQLGTETVLSSETRIVRVPWSEARAGDISNIDNLYIREDRPIWLGNDTDGTYDFNERRMYWGGERGAGFAADGSVEVRIDMQEYAENANGEQIAGSTHRGIVGRPGAAVAEGRMYWEVTPERGGPIFRFPLEEQANGTVTANVPPDHPAYEMLFGRDADGKVILNADLMEVVEDRGEDRPLIYASKRGIGDLGDLHIPKEIPIEKTVFDNSIDLTRVSATDTDVVPIIPVYPGGRRELERLSQERIIYGSLTHIEKDKMVLFDKNRSKTLKQNPDAVLDHYTEAEMYTKKWSKEYSKKIAALEAQIPAMSSDTKLAICIPAAGHQEQKNIYQALKNYTYQTADKKEFEITVFVNNPQRDKQGRFMPKDASEETLREIERFKKDFPDMQVNVMYMALEPKDANIGSIRKMLTDTVLKRHHARGKDAQDLIFASNDADNLGVAPEYVAEILRKFEEDPKKETILGNIDWDPEAYIHYPEVHVGTRLFQYLNAIGRKRSGRMVTSGANTAYRSSIYAGIGGYLPEMSGAEDVAIGQAIIAARGNDTETYRRVCGYANKAMIYTSARRAIDAWIKYRRPALMQWNNEFTPFDDLRTNELDRSKPVDFGDPEIQKTLKANFEAVINQTFDEYEAGEKLGKDARNYKKVLQALGIRYRLNSQGNVEITDFSRYIEDMKRYQQEAVLKRDRISGKIEAKKQLASQRDAAKQQQKQQEQERNATFEREMRSVLGSDLAFIDVPEKQQILDAIATASNKEILHGFTIDKEHPIKEKPEGGVYYAEKDGALFVVKKRNKNSTKDIKALGSHTSVEQYLRDTGFTSDVVVVPELLEMTTDTQVSIYKGGTIDMDTYLRKHGSTLDTNSTVGVILRMTQALYELHKAGVVHGDIAPSNIIIDGTSVRLADLEDASIKQGRFANRDSIRGNRFVMPPEMLSYKSEERGLVRFDERADIYQLGATLYRLLTGNWPHRLEAYEEAESVVSGSDPQFEAFQKERLQAYYDAHMTQDVVFPEEMPAPIRRVIRKALAPNPITRYQSMAEFGLALMQAQKQVGAT